MSNSIKKTIEDRLQGIDVTKLVEYAKKIDDIGRLNHMLAPQYLRDFIKAYDYTNSMLSVAIRCEAEAAANLKTAESIAYLDRAGDYLKDKGIKDTAESRKKYVDVDPDVIQAQNTKAKTVALVVFLKNKLQAFRMAHDDVKKMVYTDAYQTPEEGF